MIGRELFDIVELGNVNCCLTKPENATSKNTHSMRPTTKNEKIPELGKQGTVRRCFVRHIKEIIILIQFTSVRFSQ
jgi:hypothetical protein